MEKSLRSVKKSPSALAEASLDDQLRPRGGEDQEGGGSTTRARWYAGGTLSTEGPKCGHMIQYSKGRSRDTIASLVIRNILLKDVIFIIYYVQVRRFTSLATRINKNNEITSTDMDKRRRSSDRVPHSGP
jgi:hypothetical protein